VLRYFDELYVDRVRSYRDTFPYEKALRKRRVWVKPLFAEAKDRHDMRRFRLRRLERVNAEALLIASGQNVKRLLTFGYRPPRRTAQTAALRPPWRATISRRSRATKRDAEGSSAAETPGPRHSAPAWQAKTFTPFIHFMRTVSRIPENYSLGIHIPPRSGVSSTVAKKGVCGAPRLSAYTLARKDFGRWVRWVWCWYRRPWP
jgi:hypothetical protein